MLFGEERHRDDAEARVGGVELPTRTGSFTVEFSRRSMARMACLGQRRGEARRGILWGRRMYILRRAAERTATRRRQSRRAGEHTLAHAQTRSNAVATCRIGPPRTAPWPHWVPRVRAGLGKSHHLPRYCAPVIPPHSSASFCVAPLPSLRIRGILFATCIRLGRSNRCPQPAENGQESLTQSATAASLTFASVSWP